MTVRAGEFEGSYSSLARRPQGAQQAFDPGRAGSAAALEPPHPSETQPRGDVSFRDELQRVLVVAAISNRRPGGVGVGDLLPVG